MDFFIIHYYVLQISFDIPLQFVCEIRDSTHASVNTLFFQSRSNFWILIWPWKIWFWKLSIPNIWSFRYLQKIIWLRLSHTNGDILTGALHKYLVKQFLVNYFQMNIPFFRWLFQSLWRVSRFSGQFLIVSVIPGRRHTSGDFHRLPVAISYFEHEFCSWSYKFPVLIYPAWQLITCKMPHRIQFGSVFNNRLPIDSYKENSFSLHGFKQYPVIITLIPVSRWQVIVSVLQFQLLTCYRRYPVNGWTVFFPVHFHWLRTDDSRFLYRTAWDFFHCFMIVQNMGGNGDLVGWFTPFLSINSAASTLFSIF
ncbi:hypothetical protein V6N11_052205 [Hibiscus sabdariffa]|uniref:Maturase K n=1 Tax=Hibiscus sabdariffa TaxID=183260 RepID=A0ABR2U9X0_9ROSI